MTEEKKKITLKCDNCDKPFEMDEPENWMFLPVCSEKCREEFVKIWNEHAKSMED